MNLKKVMAIGACVAACSAAATDWTAVWKCTSTGGTRQSWATASNWVDDKIGGEGDDVNLAAPFADFSKGGYCQSVAIPNNATTAFHSITGIPKQIIGRASDENHGNVKFEDGDGFLGTWALQGTYDEIQPNPGEGKATHLWRVVNGWNATINVLSGSAYVRDLLGGIGILRVRGAGETILQTPRNPDARVAMETSTKLTIASPDGGEPAIVTRGMRFHFDADDLGDPDKATTVEEGGRTYVTKWFDTHGANVCAYSVKDAYRPFVSTETANGHPLLDFGGFKSAADTYDPANAESAFGPAAYMKIARASDMSVSALNDFKNCEAIVVAKAHAANENWDRFRAFLGHNSEYYWAMVWGKNTMFNPQYSKFGSNGTGDHRLWLDGVPYTPSFCSNVPSLGEIGHWKPTDIHVIAVNMKTTKIPVTTLANCRGWTDYEFGGCCIGEVLVYTNELTDVERRQTIEALKRKWLTGVEAKDFDLDSVVVGANDAKINVEAGNTAKVRSVRVAQNVASSASVVKTGGGRLEVEQILPRNRPLEVRGGSVLFTRKTPPADASRDKVPTDGMICWLDATAAGCFDDATAISEWKDCRAGVDNVVGVTRNNTGTSKPVAATDSTSGLTMVDFGHSAPSKDQPYLLVQKNGSGISGVYEGFVVWKTFANSKLAPVSTGDRGSLRNDHDNLLYDVWDYGYASGANWDVNGMAIETTAFQDFLGRGLNGPSVLHFAVQSSCTMKYLGLTDWSNGNACGGNAAIGEYIAYDHRLTPTERQNVTAYLMKKWRNGEKLPLEEDDTVIGTVNFADGVEPTVGTDTDRTINFVDGAGTFHKIGAGKTEVKAMGSGINVLDVQEGSLKAMTDWMSDAWLHVDASDISSFDFASGSGDGAEIAAWNDVRRNGLSAKSVVDHTTGNVSTYDLCHPVYRASADASLGLAANMPYVDFLAMATKTSGDTHVPAAGMYWFDASGTRQTLTDVREIHFVYTFTAGNCAVIGSESHQEDGLTPSSNNYGGYYSSKCTVAVNSPKKSDDSAWFTANRFHPTSFSDYTTKFHVTSVAFTNNVQASSFGVDRNCGVGGIRLCEVLIYRGATNELARTEAIHKYLCKKWKSIGEGASMPVFNGVNIASGATAELANLSGGAISLAKLTGAGTFKAEGVSGLGEIGAAVSADGTVSCATLTGGLTLAETGVVTVSLGNPKPAPGRHRILAAASVANPEAIAGWTLQVAGASKCSFSISADATGVYLNVVKPGMVLIVR